MFVKRDDGLGPAFLPYELLGLIAAVLLTPRSGVSGWLLAPVFLGWWLCGFLASLALFVLFCWIVSLTVNMKESPSLEDHPFYRKVVLMIVSLLCRLGRVRIHYTGDEKMPDGRYLVVSNHRSGYDPILTVWALRKRTCAIITKPENHRIPIAGPLTYKTNFLPINREDPREAMKTINAAAEILKNDVVSMGVYPEGTRNREPENGLLPFHNGVFKIAQKASVPLVVVTIQGTERIMKNTPWRPTEVYIHICEVIPPEEIKGSTAAISQRVRRIMEEDLAGAGA